MVIFVFAGGTSSNTTVEPGSKGKPLSNYILPYHPIRLTCQKCVCSQQPINLQTFKKKKPNHSSEILPQVIYNVLGRNKISFMCGRVYLYINVPICVFNDKFDENFVSL